MLRLFVSFYLFIALSLITISSVLDLLWPDVSYESTEQAELVTVTLAALSRTPDLLYQTLDKLDLPYSVQPINQVNWLPEQQIAFEQGKAVSLFDESAEYIYLAVDEASLVMVTVPIVEETEPYLLAYMSVFLVLLGTSIAFWLWPIWRDLTQLTKQINNLDSETLSLAAPINKNSLIQPVAAKLTELSERVAALINEQKELTGAVAHEFRTPIARLKFAIEMQSQSDDPAWQGVIADLNELESLVQELLDYTHYDAITPELNMAELPIKQVCEAQLAKLPPCPDKQIRVLGPNVVLVADGHFVERAILNLLTNALRYAHKRIEIRILITAAPECQLSIEVHDDGTGVPSELAEKLFEPFFRPDASRSRYAGGAGLGLAIVKRIQTWHCGDCDVVTSDLGGACFRLQYPLPSGTLAYPSS